MQDSSAVIDFKAIYESKAPQTPAVEDDHGTYTEDDFLEDLLDVIDETDVEELKLANIPESGIQAEEQAEYFIQRYKQLAKECESINKVADERIGGYTKKVENWRTAQLKRREATMGYYFAFLEEYAQERLAGKKKRSLPLIEGTLAFTKQQPVYDTNKDKIRDFLLGLNEEEQGKFLEPVPQKVKWDLLKKAGTLDDHGIFRYGKTAVPGVVVTQRPDKFSVK